jgi:cytochrome P450
MNAMSPVVPQPDHVPAAAVYDFDMFRDEGLLTDPHERIREILRVAPKVFWTPRNGGHWVATGHAENYAASRDTENFSSQLLPMAEAIEFMKTLPADTHFPTPTPITMDPPVHTKFRAPLNPFFSPKAMLARKDEVRALANSLIDKVIDQGQCDFIPAIAEPLAVQVFLKLMGLPIERQAEFRDLVHEFLLPITNPTDSISRMRKVADAMTDVIKARRIEPQDDLISLLWSTEIDGRAMTFELMEDYGVLLFIAGLDTVINGMGFGIRHLARNPELQQKLRDNPKLIVESGEEILRRYTFTVPLRRVAKDVELGGWTLKEDDRLLLYLPAADLDEREFPQPENFDLDRENRVHIAFGVGPHRCLGSHLARIELQVIYEQMLTRLPMFRLADDKPAKFHAGNIIAIDSLPILWD